MKYMNGINYQYIMNKYHNQDGTFDPYNRFVRNDKLFSENTGLSPELILDGIRKQDEGLADAPHPIRKAKAFEYVLKNTRISCDKRDRFPHLNMLDLPINHVLTSQWHSEIFDKKIPDTQEKIERFRDSLVTILPDYCHSVPVWDRLLSLGFFGIRKESERIRKELSEERILTEEETAFFDGIQITYTAIILFLGRLSALAFENPETIKMAKALQNLKDNPPSTFYEALLLSYLYFILCEHIEGMQVRSLSNFDRLYYPYYKKDLENGIPEIELREDLAYFMLQFSAIGHPQQNPVYLGGCKRNGETEINPLSYVFLDVYDEMGLFNPKIQIKIAQNTPKSFILKALDMIRRGHNSILFISDLTIRKALIYSGATEEEARTCDIKGCAEYAPQDAMNMGMNYFNALKPLEFAMHAGCDGVTGAFMGLKSPEIDTFDTFDAFYCEYKRQLKHSVEMIIEIVNSFEGYLSYISPQSMFNGTSLSCLKKAKCSMAGGTAFNNSELSVAAIGDVCDSFAMIKKYVFEKKQLTLKELKAMLDNNFEGSEKWRYRFLSDKEKYGNNRELPDFFAKDITDFMIALLKGRQNARGGQWCFGLHVAEMVYHMSHKTLAAPNGRVLGDELSKNGSPVMGQNREGVTAAILSNTKMELAKICGNTTLDIAILPSAVKDDDGLEAMYGLLKTFIKQGGNSLNINVFNSDMLRNAQKDPEKYKDLQIRVCGWNVLFCNLTPAQQEKFILQAESLI